MKHYSHINSMSICYLIEVKVEPPEIKTIIKKKVHFRLREDIIQDHQFKRFPFVITNGISSFQLTLDEMLVK